MCSGMTVVVLYQHLPAGTEEVMANCSQGRHRRLDCSCCGGNDVVEVVVRTCSVE